MKKGFSSLFLFFNLFVVLRRFSCGRKSKKARKKKKPKTSLFHSFAGNDQRLFGWLLGGFAGEFYLFLEPTPQNHF